MSNDFLKMPEKIFGISSSLIKLFLLPVGMVVAFIVSLGLIIIPKFDSLAALNKSIGTVKSEIKSTEQKKTYLASIDYEELIKNESYLSSAVLQAKNSYLLVGVMRSIADKYGFQVKGFSIDPINLKEGDSSLKVANKDIAVKMPIDIILSGPEEKSLDLIKAIENSLPILTIDNFNITAKPGTTELELTVSSYYLDDKTEFVSGNLTLNDLMPTKEEKDLLTEIIRFDRNDSLIKSLSDQNTEGKIFEEYNRENPFTP